MSGHESAPRSMTERNLATINEPYQQGFDSASGDVVSTYASAFGALSAKANVAVAPTTDRATGRIVIPTYRGNQILVVFGGTGADNANYSFRIWRWLRMQYGTPAVAEAARATPLWVPVIQAVGTAQMGTKAIGHISNVGGQSARWCDTLALTTTYMPASLTPEVFGAVNNDIAQLIFDPLGESLIEIECTLNGGTNTPTGMNLWWKRI